MTDEALERSIDELYTAPAAEFVPRRKALASELKKEKRVADAARVLALVKPNAVAAAVNRASAARSEAFCELVAAGERVVAAFRATLSSGQSAVAGLTAAQKTQRERVAALTRAIGEDLRAAGSTASAETMTRVEGTLLAISTTGRFGDARWSRLIRELEPPGLELLMEAAAAGAPAHAPKDPAAARSPAPAERHGATERDAEQQALQEKIDRITAALAEATRASRLAGAAREKASKERDAQHERVEKLRAGVEEAAKRLAELEDRLTAEQHREQELDAALREAVTGARDRAAEVEELNEKKAKLVARQGSTRKR